MEDHVIVPFIEDIAITDEEHSLRAYWSDYASLPMMDDGVITWYKKRMAGFSKVFSINLNLILD